MASGEQSGAGRGTETVCYVAIGAAGSVCRQSVDIRRRYIQAAVETYVPITKVICENENDVRTILCRSDVTQGQPPEKRDEKCRGTAPDF